MGLGHMFCGLSPFLPAGKGCNAWQGEEGSLQTPTQGSTNATLQQHLQVLAKNLLTLQGFF